ncbi:oxygen-independent coproporphyrinogen III oxidase [Saccharobesus litoralis]|uniref:Coproporphyrinogen-III oxidase n=1 Tax=Saccharobesus litoralis TaxID=2172099 RepID=A0A2S0VQM1_9ALTE|nr:oxygen-independent coproporphyrinogen III oxidase [Saccharobesus litoralis]AWB66511.1 oxygen-independent coproporphyrinogen III oxidase [Saccharobesus litoralis]
MQTVNNQWLWDQKLIEKYNYSGPRYTSYPTALEFDDSFSEANFHLEAQRYAERNLSLYIHIPFCHKLCYFCGCNKVVTRHQHKADIYIDYLLKEIESRAALFTQRKVTQIHFGGGTPTFLNRQQFGRIMQRLQDLFAIQPQAEISIEIDPRELPLDMLDSLRDWGFNRLSLGVQDFNKEVQQAVNREQDEQVIFDIIARAKSLGFASTNIDLIYGLPLQTEQSFMYTLQRVCELNPDRLTMFNYAHMPKLFAAQRKIKEGQLPSAQTKLNILHAAIDYLGQQGYQFIGMDHFAKVDDELAVAQRQGELHRNFQGYTTQGDADLLGLGVSAISQLGDSYSQNHKELKDYYRAVDDKQTALTRGIGLNRDDKIRRFVIKQLICNFELDKWQVERQFLLNFADYFKADLALLKPMVADGLLSFEQDKIKVNPQGRLLIRNICMCFDVYLREKMRQRQFSRVI